MPANKLFESLVFAKKLIISFRELSADKKNINCNRGLELENYGGSNRNKLSNRK